MIETTLHELGLSEREIKVFLEIVKAAEISATELSRRTKLHRPTVYDIISSLISKGLITQVVKEKKKSFQPVDFTKFLSKLKEKEQLAYLAVEELNKLHKPQKGKYKVEVFEGTEGLKSYIDHILTLLKNSELKDYLVLGSTLNSTRNIKLFLLSRLKDSMSSIKNVDFRIIWNHETLDDELKKSLSPIAKSKMFPKDTEMKCTTVVFNEYIALFFDADKSIIILIKSKDVANTYRNQFNFLWNILD